MRPLGYVPLLTLKFKIEISLNLLKFSENSKEIIHIFIDNNNILKLIFYILYKGIRNFNFYVLNFFYPRVTSIVTQVLEKRRSTALLTPDLLKRSSINISV